MNIISSLHQIDIVRYKFQDLLADVTEDQLVKYAWDYLLHMFRGFIFTRTAVNTVSLFYLTSP